MISETREITLEEYKALEKMEPKKAYQWIEDRANSSYANAGYGFYSPFKYKDSETGKYYIKWFRGESCD